MIQTFRDIIEPALPEGCPFVIGGGLIRDAILGGRPGDIDIWVPSNLAHGGLSTWVDILRNSLDREQFTEVRSVFMGPGAEPNPDAGQIVPVGTADGTDYGDVNNHWVIEIDSPVYPKVNIMRSMTPWNNGPQAYFDGLMRAFDIDYCMFFVGYERNQSTINTVIMPMHLIGPLTGRVRTWTELGSFRINEFYFNRFRLQRTSQARIDARLAKMCDKYGFRNERTMTGRNNGRNVIPMESIVATPVLLSSIMPIVNAAYGGIVSPTMRNRMTEAAWVANQEAAQLRQAQAAERRAAVLGAYGAGQAVIQAALRQNGV